MSRVARGLTAVLASCAIAGAHAEGALNVVCSVPLAWCDAMTSAFARDAGVSVRLTQKGSGEALEQLAFERPEPRHDVWYGGTYDAHLRAARAGLTAQYRSPHLPELLDWAVRAATQADFRTVGIYTAVLGIAYNHVALGRKHLPPPRCWSDLGRPEYAGLLQAADPHASGTGYEMIVTLVQTFGEDRAFELMHDIDRNVSAYPRTHAGAMRAAARGEAVIAVAFLHDAATEIVNGFPITLVVPCEGGGYDVGSMSIVDRGPNPVNAKKFYDWALTPAGQKIGGDTRNFETPSNGATPTMPAMPNASAMRLGPHDFAAHGDESQRARLLARWDREAHAVTH